MITGSLPTAGLQRLNLCTPWGAASLRKFDGIRLSSAVKRGGENYPTIVRRNVGIGFDGVVVGLQCDQMFAPKQIRAVSGQSEFGEVFVGASCRLCRRRQR